MVLEAEVIVDRRRLRRKLTLWRLLAVIAVGCAVLAAAAWLVGGRDGLFAHRSAHIARISVNGLITDDRRRLKLIERLKKTDSVKAVILSINSPGGTTAGGEALYNALRDLAEAKPLVSEIGTLGASAGYMIALASDHIVARRNSLTGSIGVIVQFGEVSQLLDKLGIKMDAVKSAPLKAEPSPYAPTSEGARKVLQDVVDDTFKWFVGLVEKRRKFAPETASKLADGRIFTGAQAKSLKLIDAVGGEREAIKWLTDTHKIDANLPIVEWKVRRQSGGFGIFGSIARAALETLGLAEGEILPTIVESAKLDGLLSVWHASSYNK